MHYTPLFAAVAFFANTVSVGALPHDAPTLTISASHSRYNSKMTKSTGKPRPQDCQYPTCMPSQRVPTFSLTHPVPSHVHHNMTSSSKHSCTDKRNLSKSPTMARSFDWPSATPSPSSSPRNITLRAVSSIQPAVASEPVHGDTALAIGLAAAALALIVGGPGVYFLWRKWVKKGKARGGEEEKKKNKGVVRACRIGGEGEAWDVRSVREADVGKV